MPNKISRSDVDDTQLVDAIELIADGIGSFIDNATIVSVTSSTKTIVLSGIDIKYSDDSVESGDILEITGNAAAGYYTVDDILDEVTFTVNEVIADATGGEVDFIYPAGSTKIGVDPTNLTKSSSNRLQRVIEDIDAAVTSGGITEVQHKILRQLIHFIEDGPAEGFASGAYKETAPISPFPTSEIWWESSSKLKKIISLDITWTGILSTQEIWKVYDIDGSTILATITDTITHSGVFESNRTRTIVVP